MNIFFLGTESDDVPVVDIDISDPGDDKRDGPVEGSDKIVVSNSYCTSGSRVEMFYNSKRFTG